MTDHELLRRYKDGDQSAFTDFFNRHVHAVTHWVAKRWNLPLSDIDIAVQSAFLCLSRRTEIPDNPLVYLQQASIQRVKKMKARQKKYAQRFTPIHEIDFDNVSIAGDKTTAHFIAPEPIKEHRFDMFDRAIQSLPPKESEVLCELRKDNNMLRTARDLGIDWKTVKRRRDKAIANLKPLLA